jgi:hypothetical protein
MSTLLRCPIIIDDTYIGKRFTIVNARGEEVEDTVKEFVTIWMAKKHRTSSARIYRPQLSVKTPSEKIYSLTEIYFHLD